MENLGTHQFTRSKTWKTTISKFAMILSAFAKGGEGIWW
jgi:hypothetical protein